MDDFVIAGSVVSPSAIIETFDTSGGPGGQHANRNETAVRLKLNISTAGFPSDVKSKLLIRLGDSVEVVASDSRSQFRNRAIARQRLRDQIETALIDEPPRRPTRPTRGSKKRRVDDKRARGETKRLRGRPDVVD